MATLALAAAGAAVGSAVLPAGVTILGATISGAAIGSQIGSLAGSYVDQALFGSSGEQTQTVEGPRLGELHVTSSTEGAPIPKVYGRARLGGQIIWATEFEEESVVRTQTSGGGGGGKGGLGGGGGSSSSQTTTQVDYNYYANFAVALSEGEISSIGRVWADGNELNLSRITHRVYLGTQSQNADSLIVADKGVDAPAYRGTAYIVFEHLPLADFGNRVPQMSFEVSRAVEPFGEEVRGIVLIPGSGEFVYATTPIAQDFGGGSSQAQNVHTRQGRVDWSVAIDQLESTLPNAKNISYVVSWFGTDLRAGNCEIKPGVEIPLKDTVPRSWRAGGVDRAGAHVVSTRDGRPAYGGTPSDASTIEGIEDLNARGFKVTYAPFVLMDIAPENGLADPYGAAEQLPYPWRGRITSHPAPGQPGSPDKTAAAGPQIQSFVGTASVSDFSLAGKTVNYSGPQEWSYRRMVLHQAFLAKAAGGVDAFLIGTELRGLSWVRDSASNYPFVAALIQLAADVKSILGSATKVTYAADWSEYFGHQPTDGTGDVYFHLDPLWASPNIDAIGIDCYWPLADWRDGRSHLDFSAGNHSIYELEYLRSNVQGGEGYDWFYASTSDRDNQIRTPITDGTGKPWVFRYKDIKNWWLNQHVNRPGGVEAGPATAWVPQSKPFWLMEVGCPAADKGANQPNVFVDPKSSESFLPYYSSGSRDDYIQRRYLRALLEAFDAASEGYISGSNPVSSVYSGRMLDSSKVFVYCWDARPYPAFPYDHDVWGDGENWRLGHWLTGRFSSAPLAELVATILEDFEFFDHAAGGLNGTVPGFVIDRVMSARDALQPLGLAYFFDTLETGGRIAFRHRGAEPVVASLTDENLVENRAGEARSELTRGQETELPASAKISYLSSANTYQRAVAEARRLVGASGRVAKADLSIVLEPEQAGQIAETWLFEAWTARERAKFTLPPSQLALEPGDVVEFDGPDNAGSALYRITEIGEHGARDIEARRVDPTVYNAVPAPQRQKIDSTPIIVGQPHVQFLDLPLLRGDEPPQAGYVAATQQPWPGAVAVFGSPEQSGYALRTVATAEAVVGTLLDPLGYGASSRIDNASKIRVTVPRGELFSVSRLQLLQGENVAAVAAENGGWEVLQFERADLVAPNVYELSVFLRGQAGTEGRISIPGSAAPIGSTFVLLDGAIAQIELTINELRRPYTWRFGPASKDLGDPTYSEVTHAFQGEALKPYAPVHVRAVRSVDDLNISWIRRTRIGGDSWEVSTVPLSETHERYELDIFDGTTVVRTLSASQPSIVYSAAQQIEDFGSLQTNYAIELAQMSDLWGRGSPAHAVL